MRFATPWLTQRFSVADAGGAATFALALCACGGEVKPENSAPEKSPAPTTDPSRGCGLGTSCTPGNDLSAPLGAEGIQIVTPPGLYTVSPGQELFQNYCVTLSNASEFDVGAIQSWMTAGSSHELIVYHQAAGAGPGVGTTCTVGAASWMYASSIAGQVVELKMPDGVGVPLPAGTQIVINMHLVNIGTAPDQPQVKVNLLRASNFQSAAAPMVSFNMSIDIPGATATGAGTQTVQGTCTPPAGAHFFLLGTLTNALATSANVTFVSGGQSTEVVHTTDWQRPDVRVWTAPSFLTIGPGDSFDYSCSYSNPGPTKVTVGEGMGNEKCMAIGYFFPAGSAACY